MVVKVKPKIVISSVPSTTSQSPNPLKVPSIVPLSPTTPNIIIRALKIMLMDIRMLIHPKQTSEELETYSQFANLVYRRK